MFPVGRSRFQHQVRHSWTHPVWQLLTFYNRSTYFREYPCDHYTSVINVTLLMTGCPRVAIQSSAIQLLQLLDKRFFGTVRSLHPDGERGECVVVH